MIYLRAHNSVEEISFEVIKPIVKVKTGQVISEATRQKLSAASRRRWIKTKAVTAARKLTAHTDSVCHPSRPFDTTDPAEQTGGRVLPGILC